MTHGHGHTVAIGVMDILPTTINPWYVSVFVRPWKHTRLNAQNPLDGEVANLDVVLSPLLLHKSVTIIYPLLSESHHHLTPSNVTSKITTLPHHNTHHLATPPHLW